LCIQNSISILLTDWNIIVRLKKKYDLTWDFKNHQTLTDLKAIELAVIYNVWIWPISVSSYFYGTFTYDDNIPDCSKSNDVHGTFHI